MKNRNRFLPLIVYALVLMLVFGWANGAFGQKSNTIPYSDLRALFRAEQVEAFIVEGDTITLKLRQPYAGKTTLSSGLADTELFRQELQPLFEDQTASGVLQSYDFVPART